MKSNLQLTGTVQSGGTDKTLPLAGLSVALDEATAPQNRKGCGSRTFFTRRGSLAVPEEGDAGDAGVLRVIDEGSTAMI